MSSYRIGVDVGGTFTDLILLNEETGEVKETKVLTTYPHPTDGVLQALKIALSKAPGISERIHSILHGTTIATNSLIERKGAKTALLTSRGFRDVLEIGRQIRPSLFDWSVEKPSPLVPRKWRFELNERVKSDGMILASPSQEEVEQIGRRLKEEGIESVAISFLFSFLNRKNEEQVADQLREKIPHLSFSLSSQVLPEYREYERTSTTCANAFITPVLDRYMKKLEEDLRPLGLYARVRLLQSNGGVATAEGLKNNWITTALSGPAGGVTAATYLARLNRIPNAISMDIGGTSCDTCLIKNGLPGWTTECQVGGLPIRTPMIDVKSIGAGGGSIIHVDSGGFLRVGPASCGSVPGPVGYDRGGEQPAVTDAHLLIGTLRPEYFLQKGIRINQEKVLRVMEKLGAQMGLNAEEVAAGAIEVMNHNVAQAIRLQVMLKGYDLSTFSLIAFGGAGPLHACFVADLLGIRRVILPNLAGVFSALGAGLADFRYDFVQAHPAKVGSLKEKELEDIFQDLRGKGVAQLQGLPPLEPRMDYSLDLRYVGQSFEINVPLDPDWWGSSWMAQALERYHLLHEEIFGYCDRKEPVELVNLRLNCFALTPKPKLVRQIQSDPRRGKEEFAEIYSPTARRKERYILTDRAFLIPGEEVKGPSLILSENSTAIVPATWRGIMDDNGTITLEKPNKRMVE